MEESFAERLRGLAEQDGEARRTEQRLCLEFNALWLREVSPAIRRAFGEAKAAFFGRGLQVTDSFYLALRRGNHELSFLPKLRERRVRVRVANQHGTESKLYDADELTEELIRDLTCNFLENAKPNLL